MCMKIEQLILLKGFQKILEVQSVYSTAVILYVHSVCSYPAPVIVSVLLIARLTTSDASTLPMADGFRSLS